MWVLCTCGFASRCTLCSQVFDRPSVKDCDEKAFGNQLARGHGYFYDAEVKACNVIRPSAFPLLRLARLEGNWDAKSCVGCKIYLPRGFWFQTWAPTTFFADPPGKPIIPPPIGYAAGEEPGEDKEEALEEAPPDVKAAAKSIGKAEKVANRRCKNKGGLPEYKIGHTRDSPLIPQKSPAHTFFKMRHHMHHHNPSYTAHPHNALYHTAGTDM